MEESKLLGHVIFKYVIHTNLSRVEAISHLGLTRNKKEIQSFNAKTNFLRRFIPNLAEHLKEMTNMLKKDSEVKRSLEVNKSFHAVNVALSTTPSLTS